MGQGTHFIIYVYVIIIISVCWQAGFSHAEILPQKNTNIQLVLIVFIPPYRETLKQMVSSVFLAFEGHILWCANLAKHANKLKIHFT